MLTQVTGIDLLLTYQCTGQCDHCIYRAGPHHSDEMTDELFHSIINDLKEQPLRHLLLFGGEPLLLYKKLLHFSRIASETLPGTSIAIITNGYWGTNSKRIQKTLASLRSAGISHLTLSYDVFHAAHVPPTNIQRILKTLEPDTMQKVTIDTYYVLSKATPSFYNQRTKKLVEQLAIPPYVHHNEYDLRIAGRMTDNIKGIHSIDHFHGAKCPVPFWIGKSLANPSTIEIDSSGYITLCPGICIGRLPEASLSEILNSFNPYSHPVIVGLEAQGIGGLIQLARTHGVFNEHVQVISPCHACYELRRMLQPIFPDNLAPAHIYSPNT